MKLVVASPFYNIEEQNQLEEMIKVHQIIATFHRLESLLCCSIEQKVLLS